MIFVDAIRFDEQGATFLSIYLSKLHESQESLKNSMQVINAKIIESSLSLFLFLVLSLKRVVCSRMMSLTLSVKKGYQKEKKLHCTLYSYHFNISYLEVGISTSRLKKQQNNTLAASSHDRQGAGLGVGAGELPILPPLQKGLNKKIKMYKNFKTY